MNSRAFFKNVLLNPFPNLSDEIPHAYLLFQSFSSFKKFDMSGKFDVIGKFDILSVG